MAKGVYKRKSEPKNKIKISKEILKDLYLKKHLSSIQISKLFNCSSVTITNKLKENNIKFSPYDKKCKICGSEFLVNSTDSRDKKFCSKKCQDKEYYWREIHPKYTIGQLQKNCRYCKNKFITLPKHPSQVYCSRECCNKDKKNTAWIKISNRKFYEKNKEKLKAYQKEYNKKNSEKVKKRFKNYYQKNKEKRKQYHRKWYYENNNKENKRRIKLGLPLIGEGYMKEMELLFLIKRIFPNQRIISHTRRELGKWSHTGLELDIYLPELRLAFEYMGKQHYDKKVFNNLFGRDKEKNAFEYLRYKDKCKKRLCKLNKIKLIKIKYNEKLSEIFILSKLKKAYTNKTFPIIPQKQLNYIGVNNGHS